MSEKLNRRIDSFLTNAHTIVVWAAVALSVIFDPIINGIEWWAADTASRARGRVVDAYTGAGNLYCHCREALARRFGPSGSVRRRR